MPARPQRPGRPPVAAAAADKSGCGFRERAPEILHARKARFDAVPLHHPPIGNIVRLLTREQIGSGMAEVSGNRLDPADNVRPLGLGAAQAAAGILHLLHLPVDAAKRLGRVGVDGALVMFPIADQANQKLQLRIHHAVIHLPGRGQALARDAPQLLVRFAIERQLSREGGLRVVLQRRIGRLKNAAVTICAEVGGRDRVEEKVPDEESIAEGLEALDRRPVLNLGAEPDRTADAPAACGASERAHAQGDQPRSARHFPLSTFFLLRNRPTAASLKQPTPSFPCRRARRRRRRDRRVSFPAART